MTGRLFKKNVNVSCYGDTNSVGLGSGSDKIIECQAWSDAGWVRTKKFGPISSLINT